MEKKDDFLNLFKVEKPIIGMLHLNGGNDEGILDIAKRESEILMANGVDAVLVENYFCRRINVVAKVLNYLATNHQDITYGVNILGNYEISFDLANEYWAKFIQIDSVAGHLKVADGSDAYFEDKINHLRSQSNAFLLGGVRFKYQKVLSQRSVEEDLTAGMKRCDAIVVTGEGTGIETDLVKIKTFREIIGSFPLVVGAGLTSQNCYDQLSIADAGIVGSYLKTGHIDYGDVSPEYTSEFVGKVKTLRKSMVQRGN